MQHLRTTLSAFLFASAVHAAGREASVELEITVGADGLVIDARVLAPVVAPSRLDFLFS
jgi:hypothetical protein